MSTTSKETRTSARVYGVENDYEPVPVRFSVTHTIETAPNGIIAVEHVHLIADMSDLSAHSGFACCAWADTLALVRNGKRVVFAARCVNYTGAGRDRELFSVSWTANVQDVLYTLELLND